MKILSEFSIKKSFFPTFFISLFLLGITTSLLPGCSYITVSDEMKQRNHVDSPNRLGIAIVQGDHLYNRAFRSASPELIIAIKKILEEKNRTKEQLVNIDTLGDGSEYDYTQEFSTMEKKNILELQYLYERTTIPVVMNWLGLITLGILPIKQTFQFTVTPIIHDSNGKATSLSPIQSSTTINEWKSWFLFPFGYTKSREVDYLQYILSESIDSALKEIETKKIALSSFKPNSPPLELPFRMSMDPAVCDVTTSFGNRSIIAAKPGNFICFVSVLFANKTENTVFLNTGDFKIVVGGKEFTAMTSVPTSYGKEENLTQSLSLEKGDSGWNMRMVFFFSYPKSLGDPTVLRYTDKQISTIPVEAKFKLFKKPGQ
ncbi:hypothetical protein LPTSP3_g11510 [Leptospira kobayashii]|uniref:Lipoprotein n=1 Tax=Leptospira kobayashii TaxID=1917830 RepID=A0ABN6KBT6_9LEPT|nr:hypothetical protein [Leptospira kobayashii]BDA78221.1 hypothetical protein LPTSP3_g11510 [Leptospira kobayashii]